MSSAPRAATAVDLVVIASTKLGISAVVWALGVRAISDDDFSRVVLAQKWVVEPRLDPTGSSWLPLPFWLNGAVMELFGRSLETARVLAWVLGVVSALLIYAAARLLVQRRRDAYVGALVAAAIPYGAVLGVATVPELPTAALCTLAVATATSRAARARLWGGAALLAACLSRYEPWLLALPFAALTAVDLWQRRWSGRPWRGAAAMVLCLLGPLGWLVHNALAHGDALHFLGRVSAYRQALGAAAGGPWAGALSDAVSYPLALLRLEPELALLACCLALARGAVWLRARSAAPRPVAFASKRVALLLAVMLGGLCAAAAFGGVPTHHAGRPLLTIWLLAGILVGAQLSAWARAQSGRRTAVTLGLVVLLLAVGFGLLRPRVAATEPFADRADEVAMGRAVRTMVPPGAPVLLEVVDYGYFAVMAASGRPESFALDRSVDPRLAAAPSSFVSAAGLRARLEAAGAQYWVGGSSPASRAVGRPLATAGRLGLWRARSPAH